MQDGAPGFASRYPGYVLDGRVFIRDHGSRWRGKGGVHVGMSFAELRERNGKAFGFTGFDHDGKQKRSENISV